MKKILPYGRQLIDAKDIAAVTKVLKSEFLTQGPAVAEFESALAQTVGAKYAVAFNSGTAALHAAYFAVGLQPNEEVITTPMTFAATGNASLYLDGKVKFADILTNGNIDPSQIESLINRQTKIIAPVHFGGTPVDLQNVSKIARKHKLFVVEDACHALGAMYQDTTIGDCTYSDVACFSFHPVKHITTGEGGAATTNNKRLYERMMQFRTHGITKASPTVKKTGGWFYEMEFLGFNYRLTDMQAALGSSQLKKLPNFLKRRQQVAHWYYKNFKNNPYFDMPELAENTIPAYHLFPILLKSHLWRHKKAIFEVLHEQGLRVQVHYIPVYWHPHYQALGFKRRLCPKAEDFYQAELSIPMYADLSESDLQQVRKILYATCEKFI